MQQTVSCSTQPLIIFDGVCNLCNKWINLVLKYDKQKQFYFSTLQGKTAMSLLNELPYLNAMQSVMLIDNNKIYYKSRAIVEICKRLGFPFNIFYVLIIIPPFLRNAVYDLIAKKRYSWFGKKNQCMVPTENVKIRFID